MKNSKRLPLVAVIGMAALCASVFASEKMPNGVMMKGGQMWIVKDGNRTAMSAATIMNDGAKVTMDGAVLFKNGDIKTMKDGDRLSLDGGWLDDHQTMLERGLIMKDGKMMIFSGGKLKPMEKEMNLGDGTKVKQDGTVLSNDGTSSTMKEGDIMSMDGTLTKAGM